MKRKEISTFKRLLFVFSFIMCPIILVGFCAVWFYGKQNEQEAKNLLQAQITYEIEKYETNMQEIYERGISMLNDQTLRQLASLPEMYTDYEKSRAILTVQKELSTIKNYQNYISDVCVMVPKLQHTIHAEGYEKGSYTYLDQEEMDQISSLKVTGGLGIACYEENLILPIISRNLNREPLYALVICFSDKKLLKEMTYFANVPDSQFQFEIPDLSYTLSNIEEEKRISDEIDRSEETGIFQERWNHSKYYIFKQPISTMGGSYYRVISAASIVPETQSLLFLVTLFFFATMICITIFFRSAHKLINQPMKDLVAAFRKVEEGDFYVHLEPKGQNDFGYLYQAFNHMTEELQSSIDKIYNQKMLIQKMELKQLQAQINPHFLYNSYFLLHRLIKKEDYEKAVLLSKEMGNYFRFITRSGRDIVNLEEENGHAGIYAQLQGMRFEGRIKVFYEELPEKYKKVQVPRLIIHPILENAFGHGLENKEENGILRISWGEKPDKNSISVFIEDNGDELSEEELTEMQNTLEEQQKDMELQEVTGLFNINRRLKIFYGSGYGLYFSRSELGGLCVEVRICDREEESNGKTVSLTDR